MEPANGITPSFWSYLGWASPPYQIIEISSTDYDYERATEPSDKVIEKIKKNFQSVCKNYHLVPCENHFFTNPYEVEFIFPDEKSREDFIAFFNSQHHLKLFWMYDLGLTREAIDRSCALDSKMQQNALTYPLKLGLGQTLEIAGFPKNCVSDPIWTSRFQKAFSTIANRRY